jgi:hypothetical protein
MISICQMGVHVQSTNEQKSFHLIKRRVYWQYYTRLYKYAYTGKK